MPLHPATFPHELQEKQHDKQHAYGISLNAATFIYSYLKRRKQNLKFIFSYLQTLLSGVPPGSVLRPILFNIFLNVLLVILKNPQHYNFADDNTISAEANSTYDLLKILKEESESAVKWFRENNMIVNPEKFQPLVLEKGNKNNNTNITLNIENITINIQSTRENQ